MKVFQRASLSALGLLTAALLAFSASAARAESVASLPQPTDYVSDYAHVLSPGTITQLDQVCAELDHTKANAQLAIVTVKTLDGEDSADYADELETRWKMGRKGSDRGALLLLAVNDHKYRIEVGYGLEGILNDAKIGDIGRAMVPYLRAGDYDSAVNLAVGAMARVIAADANVDLANAPLTPNQPLHARGTGKGILLIMLLIFFGGFFLLRFLLALGIFGGWGGGPWLGGGGPFIGGGGWGSGSGLGGGASGGTGFGGFGGGSFGGGGAGGSW
jgi:uncharacterized protein